MRETIIDQDIPLAEDIRLIKKLWKVNKSNNFPEGLEFAFQLLCLKDDWIQVARIDNQLHEGKSGVHIHVLNKKVIWQDLSFQEAEEKVIELWEKIINRWFK